MLICIYDDFGPTVFVRSETFEAIYNSWAIETDSVAAKYRLLGGHGPAWLAAALEKINATVDDLETPGSTAIEAEVWDPLPIDRTSPELIELDQKLQVALEAVRSDNGYASAFHDERNQTVAALESGIRVLRENTSIHILYFKAFIIDPLLNAISRLKDSAAGTAAAIAKGAAIKWAADNLGQKLPEWLTQLLP